MVLRHGADQQVLRVDHRDHFADPPLATADAARRSWKDPPEQGVIMVDFLAQYSIQR